MADGIDRRVLVGGLLMLLAVLLGYLAGQLGPGMFRAAVDGWWR